jgi:hypothetical protein
MGRMAQRRDVVLLGGPTGKCNMGLVYWGLVKALEMGTFLHRGPVNV